MSEKRFEIPVQGMRVDAVTGVLSQPADPARDTAILLAHGAGAPLTSDFMEAMAAGLTEVGFPVLRFHYAYMERMQREGRRLPPDRRPKLEAVHRTALSALRNALPNHRILLAGKSLGGRMSTYLAADGAPAAGLVLFGYPLHPAGQPEKIRSDHFPDVRLPALFLQGTRDALCDLELLRPALDTFGGQPTVHVIEGADHSFEVLKRSGRHRDEVWSELVERVDGWERVHLRA